MLVPMPAVELALSVTVVVRLRSTISFSLRLPHAHTEVSMRCHTLSVMRSTVARRWGVHQVIPKSGGLPAREQRDAKTDAAYSPE